MNLKHLGLALAVGVALCGPAQADKGKERDKGHGHQEKSEHVVPDVVFNTPAPKVVDANSVISQVPEADALALAVVGAGVVGAVAWRRRKAK